MATYTVNSYRKVMPKSVENGVAQGFGKYQYFVNEQHKRFDELAPGWRTEAQSIFENSGGKAYFDFMMELMCVELPSVIKKSLKNLQSRNQ
jgi:hypothetical protein